MTRIVMSAAFLALLVGLRSLCAAGGDEIKPAEESIRMFSGDMQVIPGAGISDVAVGNSSVVNVSPLPGKGVLVAAREPGETTIRLWRAGAQQVVRVQVHAENLDRIYREVSALLRDMPGTQLKWAGSSLIVDGAGLSGQERKRVERLLTAYPSVINLLQDRQPDQQQMIYMDVRIIEFSRSGLSNLGVDWSDEMAGPSAVAVGDFHKSSTLQNGGLTDATGVAAGKRISPFQSYFGITTRLDSRINLLEQSGDALMIAHPILSCRNEGKASFLSGGQVPFAAASATGTPSVEFKDYGIKLDIEPVLGDDGTLFARIGAEVSDLDKSTTVNNMPGLLTRKTETEFSMKLGETIVLSGLVNQTTGKDRNAVPGLGRVPGIGRLFSSRSDASRRNELVIFVTPMVHGQLQPRLDAVRQSGDALMQRETRDSRLLEPLLHTPPATNAITPVTP